MKVAVLIKLTPDTMAIQTMAIGAVCGQSCLV